jgi:Tfp pilus assembly PilM family ATPase
MANKSLDYILGIEIAEQSLRLVQRHIPSNTIDLVHIEPISLSEIALRDRLAALLKHVVKVYRKLLRTRYAVISLPYSMTFIRTLILEKGAGELREQIEWEIEQGMVGKSGKYVFDWIELQPGRPKSKAETGSNAGMGAEEADQEKELEDEVTSEGGTSKKKTPAPAHPPVSADHGTPYLVVAVEEEHLRWMEDSLKKVRIIPTICDVDVLALINAFTLNYPEEKAQNEALVYLTGSQALMALAWDGRYIDSASVSPIKLDTPDDLRQSIQRIETGLRELGAANRTEIKHCFICGDAAADARFRDSLLAAFTLPVEVLNPFRNVSVAQEIKGQVLAVSPALAVVTGLTLRTPEEG